MITESIITYIINNHKKKTLMLHYVVTQDINIGNKNGTI
jgi:hypothetical protein